MKKSGICKEKLLSKLKTFVDGIVVDKLNAIEWGLLAFILLAIFLTLFYDDNLGMFLTYFWTNNSFFEFGDIRFLGNNQLSYGVVQQWFCEVWCLPVNIIYRIHRFTVHTTAAVIWYKLSMPLVYILCLKEMKKIGELLEIPLERIKWMLILCSSTVLVALPVFHIAQTDILYGYFVLLSLRYFMEDKWKKFILFGAMAVSCKGIALVVYIPLILLREKRILRIVRDSLLTISIFVGERIWYRLVEVLFRLTCGNKLAKLGITSNVAEDAGEAVESGYDLVSAGLIPHFYHKALFFEFGAVRKGYTASVLIVLLVLLCVFCYVQKKEASYEFKLKGLFVSAVSWLLFFTFASPSPYWIAVLYPFLFLMIFANYDRIRVNLLLETGFTLTMFLVYLVDTFWVYGGANNLDYLILKGILPEGHLSNNEGPYVARYLNNLGVGSVMNVITAICLACSIGLFVVNYKSNIKEEFDSKYEKTLMHGFTIFQIGFLFVWYAVNVLVVSRW